MAAWNHAACDARFRVTIPPLGSEIGALAQQWTVIDNFVADVAVAFRRADTSGAVLTFATQADVDKGMLGTRDYNPISSLDKGDGAEWERLVRANRCYNGGGRYLGGGFVLAPDGRRYPLVIPQVQDGGKFYNADDGGDGDVSTLDGADPGWFRTGVYTGSRRLFPTDKTDAAIGGFIVGLTGGDLPANKSAAPGDYDKLVVGDGRPRYYGNGRPKVKPTKGGLEKLPEYPGGGVPGGPVNPLPGRLSGGALAALFPVNGVQSAAGAVGANERDAYGSYRLVTERNLDGRVRARLTVYQLAKNNDGSEVIIPAGISVDGKGRTQQTLIRYRPHVDGTAGNDDNPNGDHVYKGMKEGHLLGIFDTGPEPTYQDG